ncbi:Lactococcin-G-processing and transport ATP-binding protein LagD [Chryseobacterium aquaeductus]|uniref:Lactococcin-G-processing and transport ATP-binding protein LagD n=1 Tax=Chryseobacterium aquaeductus TaxID=2675056 RepID=A0A9N8QSB6_9FLAO|nr:peptidase domain-containing ABC transporter [Chryseobacterium aquaeductus]CAA7331285.1 Lactococcin-G-processing and transport ATP-binding protein LagD [Chryseobacterium potabilaquae]CAD7809289.1 Lactococcin-G-processing and transport ATP-binding protein LagD [Chryseobacterium aquaeductus]
MKKNKHIHKTFSLQKDQTDCGVGCLQSLVRYYGGDISLETLREKSGTAKTGTTLLGLYQCAKEIGFDAEGCEADIDALIEHNQPVILHVILEKKYEHYVVCYYRDSSNNNEFLIGDPAKGIEYWSKEKLEEVWVSKTCLTLQPNESFEKKEKTISEKKQWLLNLIKEDQESIYTILVLGVFTTLLGMAMSIFSQKLIDDILPKRKLNVLFLSIGFLSFLLLGRIIIQALRDFYIIMQSKEFNQRINKSFFSSLLHLPKLFFDTRKIGDFVARLNDTQRIQNVIKHLITNTAVDILGVLISIGFLFYYSWKLAVICLVVSPIIFYIIFRFNKRIIASQKEVMQSYSINEANYIDSIRGIDVIKGFGKQDLFLEKNLLIFGNFQNKIFDLGKINIKITLYSGLALVVFLVTILGFSSYNVLNKQIKIGEMMAIIGISSSLLGSITNLALVSIPIQEAKVAFDRMFEYASIPKEKLEGPEIEDIQKIEIRQLDFRFKGRSKLLENITITLEKAKITCLLGESGSGKTTFTEILQKNYEQESGDIVINNHLSLKEISTENWRSRVSIVPQNIQLFNASFLENIILDQNIDEKKLQNVINLGFETFINSLPQGLMTIVGEEGVNLSGGQKQLLGWMRALYHNPQFLLLDEPTSSLDQENRDFIYQLIAKIKKDKIIFVISHNLEHLEEISDEVLYLKGKRISRFK